VSGKSFYPEGHLVCVLTREPLDMTLDYRAPMGGVFLGAFVEVPLGPRKVLGVVWGAGAGDYEASKIRSILNVLDLPPMREELRQFLIRAGAYTITPLPAMLRLATTVPGLLDGPMMRRGYANANWQRPRVSAPL